MLTLSPPNVHNASKRKSLKRFSYSIQSKRLLKVVKGESHIDFCTDYVIMTRRTPLPTPCYLRHFQIFNKIDSFPKRNLNFFWIKKTNCIFEELSNLYITVLLISFFSLLLWITAENRTNLKKLFI